MMTKAIAITVATATPTPTMAAGFVTAATGCN